MMGYVIALSFLGSATVMASYDQDWISAGILGISFLTILSLALIHKRIRF